MSGREQERARESKREREKEIREIKTRDGTGEFKRLTGPKFKYTGITLIPRDRNEILSIGTTPHVVRHTKEHTCVRRRSWTASRIEP